MSAHVTKRFSVKYLSVTNEVHKVFSKGKIIVMDKFKSISIHKQMAALDRPVQFKLC